MKRKLIAGAMAAMLMGAMVLPVSAATQSQDVKVSYREANDYTLTIPTEINLNESQETDVGVKDVNLEPNTSIQISITSGVGDNGVVSLEREDDTATTAVTTLSVDNTTVSLNTVFATFTADGSKTLSFSDLTDSQGGAVKAGNYSGTLTFYVSAPNKE